MMMWRLFSTTISPTKPGSEPSSDSSTQLIDYTCHLDGECGGSIPLIGAVINFQANYKFKSRWNPINLI